MSPLFRLNPLKKKVKAENRPALRNKIKSYKEINPIIDMYGRSKPPKMAFIDIRNLARETRQSKIIFEKLSNSFKKKYHGSLLEYVELTHYGRYLKKSEQKNFKLNLLSTYRSFLKELRKINFEEKASEEFITRNLDNILKFTFEKTDKFIKKK